MEMRSCSSLIELRHVQCQMQEGLLDEAVLTTTPPSNMHPTMVVPVLVALGRGTPRACSAALRL